VALVTMSSQEHYERVACCMKNNLDFSRGLVVKARNDMKVVEIGLQHDAPLDVMCFHLQQAAEKFLKALLASKNVRYPLTHDLEVLIEKAVPFVLFAVRPPPSRPTQARGSPPTTPDPQSSSLPCPSVDSVANRSSSRLCDFA